MYRRQVWILVLLLSIIWLILRAKLSHSSLDPNFDIAKLREPQNAERVRSECWHYGWEPFRSKSGSLRKVYDLFQFSNELDLLEIRLNSTWDQVDYFVVLESDRTFTNHTKPLNLLENWDRFTPYHSKIIYHLLEFPDDFAPQRPWDYEDLHRNALLEQVLWRLDGSKAPTEGDVLIISDVDEIPRPPTIALLKECDFPRRVTLRSKFFYYGFQFLHDHGEWPFPHATYYVPRERYRGTIAPTNLRNSDGALKPFVWYESAFIPNAAWHCSSCFATIEEFRTKISSFSHVWMNGDQYRNPKNIVAAVRNGRDLWNRSIDTFTFQEETRDVPSFILDQAYSGRFDYLLNRTGENGGFTDYKAWT